MTLFNKSSCTIFLLIITLKLCSINSYGQRYCGTFKTSKKNLKDANLRVIQSEINIPDSILANRTITIPVVFHVLYKDSTENVGMAKLQSQIDVLNKDFRRKNADTTDIWPQAADVGIEFCMAKIDINGNYFSGVTRTYTDNTFFNYDEDSIFFSDKGGKDIWPGYLNIYVCNLAVNELDVAGFSSLPGYEAYEDAVVLDYRFTGIFGEFLSIFYLEGRTGTHEVGHWLNLIHPWGAEPDSTCIEDDYVADTPQSSLPYTECSTGSSCGSEDMADNFMDYHYDSCANLFTMGQARRIWRTIYYHPARTFLLNNTKCSPVFDSINIDIAIDNAFEEIKACNEIISSSEILMNSDVTYTSANSVSFLSGFSIDTTSNLLVMIEPCD